MYLGKGVWIMIIEFSIANFLSFKDKVTFSMLADTKEELADNYIVKDNKKILKTAAIYGANASGKTNIMKVVGTVVNILRECNNYNIDTELPIEPFKFSKDTKNQPSEFEIKFIADDTRYVYGFSATKKKVLEEYLYYYPNNREAIIFDRTNTNEYEFNIEDKKIINDIKNKTNENKFFLATSATWNFTKVKTPYTFLSSILVSSNSNNFNNSLFKLLNDHEKEIKPFTLNMLKDADLNIEDYKIVEIPMPEEVLKNLKFDKYYEILFKHKGTDEYLSSNEESLGTINFFALIPLMYFASKSEMVIFLDEIDKSLHSYLVEHLIAMFNDKEQNSNNSQLIFNTHDTNLLDLNILRRDQIWFTEKNANTGESTLYPLSDFSVRKQENIEKGYLLGRYGAVPFIKNDFNLVKHEEDK